MAFAYLVKSKGFLLYVFHQLKKANKAAADAHSTHGDAEQASFSVLPRAFWEFLGRHFIPAKPLLLLLNADVASKEGCLGFSETLNSGFGSLVCSVGT